MDDLISCMEQIALTPVTPTVQRIFDMQLDCIVHKMKLSRVDPDIQWHILKNNYSKLRYMSDLILFNPIRTAKFFTTLDVFMGQLDKINYYYLHNVRWSCVDLHINQICCKVEILLCQSLTTLDSVQKLQYILDAYSQMVYIAEYFQQIRVAP